MKKSTKSAKPAAPQVKSIVPKPVEPKPVKKTVAPSKKAAPKAAVASPAPAAAPVAAPKPARSSRPSTKITAKIDIGFGNALYIRGDGPGLSWDRGVAMDCVNDDTWSIVLPAGDYEVIFKFLVNDLSWSVGGDFVIASGKSVEITPAF